MPDNANDIEALFAEAIAAVESVSAPPPLEVELDTGQDLDAPLDDPPPEEIEIDLELPGPPVEEEPPAEERVEEPEAVDDRSALYERIATLERERDRALRDARKQRRDAVRVKAANQRLRERLDRLQGQMEFLREARQTAEHHAERLQKAHKQLSADLTRLTERRRQEKADQQEHGQAPAILAMLPVLDHLELATQHASADPHMILQGVQMVVAQFNSALLRLGVTRVTASVGDRFQPEIHDAMLHTPTDEVKAGHIVQEIAAGYSLRGRLLRAARVSVAAPLPADPPTEPPVADSPTEPPVHDTPPVAAPLPADPPEDPPTEPPVHGTPPEVPEEGEESASPPADGPLEAPAEPCEV